MPHNKQIIALDTNIVQDNIPFEIIPNLYIGSKHACFNIEGLRASKITHILNISGIPPTYPKDFTYMTIHIHDKEESNILPIIPLAMLFLDTALKNGACLVHCVAGRSRSAAIIIAYLIHSNKFTYYEAHEYVKAKRSVLSLNLGFQRQLKAYYDAHGDVYLANQLLLYARQKELHARYSSNVGMSPFSVIQDPVRVELYAPRDTSPTLIPTLRGLQLGYLCRYCRSLLFSSLNIIKHMELPKTPQEGKRSFELKGLNTMKSKRVSVNSDSPNFGGTFLDPSSARSDISVGTPSPEHLHIEVKTPDPLDSPAPSLRSSPDKAIKELCPALSPNPPEQSPPPSPHPLMDETWIETVQLLENVDHRVDSTAKRLFYSDKSQISLPCDFVFLEPLRWMEKQITRRQGLLTCKDCHHEIGFYAWPGYFCSCSEHITPAFCIYRRAIIPHERDHELLQFTETEECPGK